MIKYTKTETIGEMQISESVEFETFDQLMDYLRKCDVVDVVNVVDEWQEAINAGANADFVNAHKDAGSQIHSFDKTSDSHKQKDLLDEMPEGVMKNTRS